MKSSTFLYFFATEDAATSAMVEKNRSFRRAGNKRDVACVTEGPENNFAVCDLNTAIELGNPYKWSLL